LKLIPASTFTPEIAKLLKYQKQRQIYFHVSKSRQKLVQKGKKFPNFASLATNQLGDISSFESEDVGIPESKFNRLCVSYSQDYLQIR
jgi:hypothetical protein